MLGEALTLWRGTPFEETPSAWLARHEAPQLIERYLGARERRIDLDLAARQYAGLVAELRGLVAQHPLRESLRVRWMLALDAAGRRAEALSGYEDYRVLLADELGIDPGVELRDLHLRLLGDPEPPVAGPAAEPATQVEIPHQLPADLPGFAGRRDLLDRLDGLLERGPGVIAIHGPGGVGKSTLAVHWASRIAGCFPDGELFLNLRGYGPGEPMPPDEAAATLLAGLGVRGGQLPVGLEACTALLRTKLSSRRMLIVLDNARDAQQVRPLLPGSGSLVVITSRNQLRGLAAREGAVRLPVECWSRHEAAWFLRDRLRQQGEHAEGPSELPDLAELSELAELCGRLPLALAVIAEWSAWGARTTVADLRTALRDEAGRLDALATADDPLTDVRLALSWSYLALEPDTARLFRFLGLHPGGGISTAAAAALAGLPIDETRRRLDHLVAASLIRAVRRDRYDLHDLLQTYAAERADETEGRDGTMPAIRRLTSYYIHSAGSGRVAMMGPQRIRPMEPSTPEPGVMLETFRDSTAAQLWFDAEWVTIGLVVRLAARHGLHAMTCELVNSAAHYLMNYRTGGEGGVLFRLGLEAARTAVEPLMEAVLLNHIGISCSRMGDWQSSLAFLKQAKVIFQENDQPIGSATAGLNIGWVTHLSGSSEDAADWLEDAVEIASQHGIRYTEAIARRNLAEVLLELGQPDRAIPVALPALQQLRELGDPDREALVQLTLGGLYASVGDQKSAESALLEALDLQARTDNPFTSAVFSYDAGRLARNVGREDLAQRSWKEALAIIDEVGVIDALQVPRDEVVQLINSDPDRY